MSRTAYAAGGGSIAGDDEDDEDDDDEEDDDEEEEEEEQVGKKRAAPAGKPTPQSATKQQKTPAKATPGKDAGRQWPGIRLTTKVINDRRATLILGPQGQGYKCAYDGKTWKSGREPVNMWVPDYMFEGQWALLGFLHDTRVIGYEGPDGKYYMLVNVPVGGDPHSKNELTFVICNMCFDSKQVRDWGDHQKIWCGASMDEVVRRVGTLVSSQQMKRLLQGQPCRRKSSIGTAQPLVKNIGQNDDLLSLGTAKTVVYTIGPFTLVVTHVEGHLPCKEERDVLAKRKEAPVADDASTMPAAAKPPIQHSAVIWIYFEEQLKSYDACDLSNSTVEETIMDDGVQIMQYTLSVHSVEDTPALSRCPVEVDDAEPGFNVLPDGWQHMTPNARRTMFRFNV